MIRATVRKLFHFKFPSLCEFGSNGFTWAPASREMFRIFPSSVHRGGGGRGEGLKNSEEGVAIAS